MLHSMHSFCDLRNRRRSLFTLLVWLLAGAGVAFAQDGFFVPLTSAQARLAAPGLEGIEKYGMYNLKTTALRGYLAKAPLENRITAAPLQLAIPMPDGTTELFAMAESPILAPALAAQYPEIKTYTGRGTTHLGYSIRLSLTSSGFDAIILGVDNSTVYVTKLTTDSLDQRYATYFARDVKKNDPANPAGNTGKCGTTTPIVEALPENPGANARTGAVLNNTGATLRTFRLAVATTKEFAAAKGGNTVDGAFNALVGYVNRLNAVYRRELSVAFTLVSGKNTIFTTGNDGGFNNADLGTMLGKNQEILDNVVGDANYDIGHAVGNSGGSGEGLAQASSACQPGDKAKGATSFGDGSFAPIFDDQTLSHEIGHQFSMSHTFNSSIPVCTTREATTSVEPGAGTTIMSYGYTCSDQNNAARNDDYEAPYQPILNFHTISYQQANTYIATLSCFTSTSLNNAVPVIGNFPASVTIPKSTPFALSATATDANAGDKLTYSWEGTNIGLEVPGDATLANTAKPPFFRSYEPATTGIRTYPRLEAVLNGSNYAKGDKLPSVGIATTHVLTVRDNVGGLTYQGLTVTIDGNSGPFLETTNLSGSYAGSSVQTITWSVANTNVAPVNSPNVNVLLSTDGGLTFPTVLAANTPNDGSEAVALPAVLTSTARIKVASSNNIFFDISNANFSITAPVGVPIVKLTAPDSVATEGAKGPDTGGRRAADSRNGRTAVDEDLTDYAYFHFERTSGNGKMTVRFVISGSAAGDSRISIPDTVSFEDGELAFDLYIIPGEDDIEEGDEDLILTLIDEADYDVLESSNAAKVTIKDNDNPAALFSIKGVTMVSCTPAAGNPNKRELTFTPQYQGTNGQPISFSVKNETLPTTAPGPYTLGIYLDNPTITLRATQSSTPGEASFTYNWLAVCGTPPPPPPTGAFAITGVTTVNCTPAAGNPNKRELTFTPQYQGTNGQSISFSVKNEMLPTTASGPYTLGVYLDNPTITLKATQSGTAGEANFAYNWLSVCGAGTMQSKMARESVAETSLEVRVLGNPVSNGRVQVEVSGTAGQPMELMLTDLRGRVINTHRVERPAPVETLTYDIGRQPVGILLLRVSTSTQAKTIKLLKAE